MTDQQLKGKFRNSASEATRRPQRGVFHGGWVLRSLVWGDKASPVPHTELPQNIWVKNLGKSESHHFTGLRLFSPEFLSSNILTEMRVKRCWHITLEILPQNPWGTPARTLGPHSEIWKTRDCRRPVKYPRNTGFQIVNRSQSSNITYWQHYLEKRKI